MISKIPGSAIVLPPFCTLELLLQIPPRCARPPLAKGGWGDFSDKRRCQCANVMHLGLENGDWLTGRPRTPGDAQRQGDEEKLITVLLGTGRYQAFGIDIINQTQPQQGNPQMDTKIEPVISDRAFIQQIPGNASHVTFAEPLETGDMQARPHIDIGYALRRTWEYSIGLGSFICLPATPHHDKIAGFNFYPSSGRGRIQLRGCDRLTDTHVALCPRSSHIEEHPPSDRPLKPGIQRTPTGSAKAD